MAWQFPNAIAEEVRAEALRRGQTADRVIERDPDDRWTEGPRVQLGDVCPRVATRSPHTNFRHADFCDGCGAFIAS